MSEPTIALVPCLHPHLSFFLLTIRLPMRGEHLRPPSFSLFSHLFALYLRGTLTATLQPCNSRVSYVSWAMRLSIWPGRRSGSFPSSLCSASTRLWCDCLSALAG